jgi:islet cell auto antigen 1
MNHYQNNVLFLSHEETDMARFLKDCAQTDKTRAGKMMGSVSKVLAYTAQQRLGLRQPLFRLYNEIDTFRHRAVTDTMATVKRMETARTEYRGSILWLKDASTQLDPEKQLENFRRVQSQVKSTKCEYDRLKSDVIQKIDLLTASRWYAEEKADHVPLICLHFLF